MNLPTRQLSRLSITGAVHENTPQCVLVEIADAHGIKHRQEDNGKPGFSHMLLQSIHRTPIPIVSISDGNSRTELTQWRCVARFVNKNSQWLLAKLSMAYDFLLKFMNSGDSLSKIPNDFTAGLQVPSDPHSVNACILYKVCIEHHLNVFFNTSIEQMYYAVRMLREDLQSLVRKVNIFFNKNARRSDLVNTLMLFQPENQDSQPIPDMNYNVIPKSSLTRDSLLKLHESLTNLETLQRAMRPVTEGGAIALAAIGYNADISRASDPVEEYKIIQMSGRNDYRPVDGWMSYWYSRNPGIFDLTTIFNPIFPIEYYDPDTLTFMARNEGFTNLELSRSNPYELLQLSHVSDTFYQGHMPGMKSTKTSIDLDDVGDVPYGQLLCYGCLDSQWNPVTVSELTDLFNNNQNFSSPFGVDNTFSSTAIGKLKIMMRSPHGPDTSIVLSSETLSIRRELVRIINEVERKSSNLNEPDRRLLSSYKNANPETKGNIRATLTNLLNVGMYMRGWNGHGEYPVREAPVDPGKESELAINVTESIAAYEASIECLGEIGVEINRLPLLIHKNGEYHTSSNTSEGLTVRERINIIKGGERSSNVESCIRLSSNWICSSAYKYITTLGFPEPFDIFHLRYIS